MTEPGLAATCVNIDCPAFAPDAEDECWLCKSEGAPCPNKTRGCKYERQHTALLRDSTTP